MTSSPERYHPTGIARDCSPPLTNGQTCRFSDCRLVTGSIYSLVAVGLVIIYRATNVLNFAHGFLVALAAFLTLEIAQHAAISVALAAIPAILIVVVLGLVIERFIVRPISGERPLTIVVATLGVSLILEGFITRQWGSVTEAFPPLISGTAFQLSGFYVSWNQVLVVSVSLCLILLLALFFQVSSLGLSMRATSENKTVAKLLGINPNLVSATSWGLAACVGGNSGDFRRASGESRARCVQHADDSGIRGRRFGWIHEC